MFAQQIMRNVQVYVDDMLVKSRREEDHLEDLKETFNTQAQSRKMCLWSDGGKIPRIYGVPKGDRGKPGQDPGHYGDGATKKCEGGAKPEWKNCGTK